MFLQPHEEAVKYNGLNMTSPRPAQGRQLQIGVTFLAWLNIYQTIKHIVQDAVAPEIQGVKGEIKGLSDRIDSLEEASE